MLRKVIKVLLSYLLLFNVLALIWILIYANGKIPVTKLMVIEKQEKDIRYEWRDLDQISDTLALAIMCSEDQNFLAHYGLDVDAILEAEKANRKGRRLRGASTLTQQVAKNLFLWPDRSWTRKVSELYFSLLIDALWSKERIMEVYLNVAEMGDGIFGAEAASQAYFRKPARKLTAREASLLAVILPNPKRYSAMNPTPYIEERSSWVREQMGYWDDTMTYDPSFLQKLSQ